MSRSAINATRFTATKPYASFNPSSISSSPSSSSSSTFPPSSSPSAPSQPFPRSANPSYPSRIPRNSNLNNAKTNFAPPPPSSGPTETPAQKVARLRRERAAKREAEFTTWDRIVLRGRVVADAAHRITVLGLVTFSGAPSLSILLTYLWFNWSQLVLRLTYFTRFSPPLHLSSSSLTLEYLIERTS